ncbi:hypothetical protein EJ08DRAFT_647879 [Tothia fuscella]|uniref:DUF7730 domain-containing protein n=1 Tax=Tothia fuscella TaxID=1048955 RepID=A0A9P4NV08_9PEZI|nr:hypothetical protein EJ08DRAFT_647879 [Tothia fuscella]
MTILPLSPLLELPVEIRLMIYQYLLVPSGSPSTSKQANINLRLIDPTEEPIEWSKAVLPTLRRSKCHIHTGRFRGRTMQTTYTTNGNPKIHAAILATCHKLHSEGAEVLYGNNTFTFGTSVEAITPFLEDLTSASKSHIKRLSLTKRALPYDRDFDSAEWHTATSSISTHLPTLTILDLSIVAGRPATGYDDVIEWIKEDFECWTKRTWAGLEWVKDLARCSAKIVNVKAEVEHCPPPTSERMQFYVEVSKSVERGFGEWVRELITGGEGGEFVDGGLDGIH